MAVAQPITLWRCPRCNADKPIGDFANHPRRDSACKDCRREQQRLHQRKHRAQPGVIQLERDRQRLYRSTEAYKAKRREYRRSEQVKQGDRRYAQSPQGSSVRRAAAKRLRIKKWVESGCPPAGPVGRPPRIDATKLAVAYEAGNSTYEIGFRFGLSPTGVAYRLRRIGVILRDRTWGAVCQCADGHIVRSTLERVVDDWLFEHGIAHSVSPRCPWPSKTTGSYARADFLVGDTFIEVWGMTGVSGYDKRTAEKIAMYSRVNAKLIQVFPADIRRKDFSKLAGLAVGSSKEKT